MAEEIIIRNESDAYEFLESLVAGHFDVNRESIKFDGWPNFHLHLQGERFSSTITLGMMKAFVDLQSGIYRAYATATYGTPVITKLTKTEREMLELVVKVEPGSSNYTIDFQYIFNNLLDKAVDKMTGWQILIAIICVAVLYFGASAYKNYLQIKKDIRVTEIKDESQKDLLKEMHFQQEQETKRMQIMANAMEISPRVQTIDALAQNTQAELLKRASAADSIEIQGVQLTGRQAEILAKNARKPVIDIRLDGVYRILNVDSADPEDFKVRVRNMVSRDEFTAVVQNETLNKAYKQALQDGEWKKKPVELTINAKQRTSDDTIYAAKIIRAVFRE